MQARARPTYLVFLRHHPLWWLLPPILIYGAIVALIFLGSHGGVAGFVYKV